MKNTKTILWVSTVVILGTVVSLGYYFGYNNEVANANPDYICVKPVTNQPCENVVWWPWQTNGTRTWTWTKATEVWYYHTRTTCETGYSKSNIQWTTTLSNTAANYLINNWESDKLYSNYTSWASWRHSSDFTFSSETCTLVEKDDIAPVWTFK